jgi:hypothetical protein
MIVPEPASEGPVPELEPELLLDPELEDPEPELEPDAVPELLPDAAPELLPEAVPELEPASSPVDPSCMLQGWPLLGALHAIGVAMARAPRTVAHVLDIRGSSMKPGLLTHRGGWSRTCDCTSERRCPTSNAHAAPNCLT